MDYDALTVDDFLGAAQGLLPTGLAWSRDPDSWISKYFRAVAEVLWNCHQHIVRLFGVEADPAQTISLLPDWQAAYKITPRGTQDQQRTQLVTVITDPGGTSATHFAALAAQLGIAPFSTVVTGTWTWEVHAPAVLSVDDRQTLEELIAANNRITWVLTFVYDL